MIFVLQAISESYLSHNADLKQQQKKENINMLKSVDDS